MKAYITGDGKKGFSIRIVHDDGRPGAHVEITTQKEWLYFSTDHSESVMVGIEALPAIIKALRGIQKEMKEAAGGKK